MQYQPSPFTNDESMAAPLPPVDIITQSSPTGHQVLPKASPLSFLTSFCNCFRVSNSSYNEIENLNLLPPQAKDHIGKNTLVLDLDETLVHSSFAFVSCDIQLEIEVEQRKLNVYVLKRPGVDEFLKRCGELFEVVLFTASLKEYSDPLLDLLDKDSVIHHRLSRESCKFIRSGYTKDLALLGRDLKHVLIIDVSYI